jgi:uncharacterized protein YlzI (FlbEa/FlbD family)
MKLVRFTLSDDEGTVAINPAYVAAVEGDAEDGSTIVLINSNAYEVTQSPDEVVEALGDTFNPPAGTLYPVSG